MSPRPSVTGPFIRMLDASAGVLTQPKGSVPRLSNLIGSKRGALRSCDGTAIVNAFNGVPTLGRGKAMCEFFFEPSGVSPYYLRIMKALDQPLGAPQNLTSATAGGGLLPAATYTYVVTAIDGVAGETLPSNSVSQVTGANGKNTLTWNVVPNATGYNVYRKTGLAGFLPVSSTSLPVPQPSFGSLTVSFVDNNPFLIAGEPVNFVTWDGANGYIVIPTDPQINSAELVGMVVAYGGGTGLAGNWKIKSVVSVTQGLNSITTFAAVPFGFSPAAGSSTGGTIIPFGPPTSDTTQQTGLYKMAPINQAIAYTNFNLVALFPADLPVDGFPPGTPNKPQSQQGSTPSGGIQGNVSPVPQIVQFTNQAVLALGNGFPPQVFSDPITPNPASQATSVAISTLSVDAFGVVTVVTAAPHNIPTNVNAGANVTIANTLPNVYNGTFALISVVNSTTLKLVNLAAIGSGAGTGNPTMALTVTTVPIYSTFVPAYPTWTTAVNYAVGSIVTPTVSNGHYYKAIQGGISGGSQPTFPTGTGQRVADGQVIWQEAGLLNSAAPPPPAAAHIAVFSGSLWVFNTWVNATATGLDGPTSLRMSDVNNMFSWNPINQAFLDKDDGSDGYGLASFTISAQGIPPEGSLIAFKRYKMYQIVGVFGASNFAIQLCLTDMGTIAPRTIQFIPGFGLGRLTHLGFGIFDGVNDRVISEPIRPYLFINPNDLDTADITPMDQTWMSLSMGAQTANPPMAIFAIPVGSGGGGALTRLCCYDLALKGWSIVDLPFPISTLLQVRTAVAQTLTLMGSFSDGTLQRWQSGDQTWATSSAGSLKSAPVSGFVYMPTTAAKEPDKRGYCRWVTVSGQAGVGATVSIAPRVAGVALPFQKTLITAPQLGFGQTGFGGVSYIDFSVNATVHAIDRIFDAIVYFSGQITFDGFDIQVEPKPLGVLAGSIS